MESPTGGSSPPHPAHCLSISFGSGPMHLLCSWEKVGLSVLEGGRLESPAIWAATAVTGVVLAQVFLRCLTRFLVRPELTKQVLRDGHSQSPDRPECLC